MLFQNKDFMIKTHLALVATIYFLLSFSIVISQPDTMDWWNPASHPVPVIEGQAWTGEAKSPYDRLPSRAEGQVRDAVWNLAGHNAGIMVRFRSNAEEIVVRYQVAGNLEMNHMPATGVSGLF